MRREISTIFSHFSVLFCGVFSRDRFFPYLLALILVVLSLQFMYNESCKTTILFSQFML